MSRRRVHAGIILVGFVVASGLAMACLIFAALSVGSHHARTTSASAATTSAAPVPIAAPLPTSSVPRKTTTVPVTATTSVTLTPTSTTPTTTAASTTPTTPAVNKGADQKDAGAQVAAGDCVGANAASLTRTACGSSSSAYKVTSTAGSCPSDSDRSVPETLPGGATNTLCMDTDWEVGRCMSMSGGSATPVACNAAVPGLVRVQAINQGTADVNTCIDANHGVVYKQRHFVVCVAQM